MTAFPKNSYGGLNENSYGGPNDDDDNADDEDCNDDVADSGGGFPHLWHGHSWDVP